MVYVDDCGHHCGGDRRGAFPVEPPPVPRQSRRPVRDSTLCTPPTPSGDASKVNGPAKPRDGIGANERQVWPYPPLESFIYPRLTTGVPIDGDPSGRRPGACLVCASGTRRQPWMTRGGRLDCTRWADI